MAALHISNADRLLQGTAIELENLAIEFITESKKGGMSGARIRRIMAAVKSFYDMNRLVLNWKFILRHVGKSKTKKDRAHSHVEIQQALKAASIRNQVLIYLYASSGVRRGAIPELRENNLKPIDKYGLYKIVVYEGSDEEYTTYCSPEARNAIDRYLELREQAGERITDQSLIVREEFDRNDPIRAAKPKQISPDTITNALIEVFEKAGLRQRAAMVKGQKAGTIRHEIKIVHGLRKFFDTQMTLSGVSPLWIELLEGHRIKGMKHHYLKPTDEQLLEGADRFPGFVAALENLTIDDAQRKERRINQLENERSEIELLKLQIADIRKNRDIEFTRSNVMKSLFVDKLVPSIDKLPPEILEKMREKLFDDEFMEKVAKETAAKLAELRKQPET